MDKQLREKLRAFVVESMRVVESNPIEIADYMYVLYKEASRLDKLSAIAYRLVKRMQHDYSPEHDIEFVVEAIDKYDIDPLGLTYMLYKKHGQWAIDKVGKQLRWEVDYCSYCQNYTPSYDGVCTICRSWHHL